MGDLQKYRIFLTHRFRCQFICDDVTLVFGHSLASKGDTRELLRVFCGWVVELCLVV
jgi:hypothetical protein